jgi:hypothetical protein
VSDELPPDRPDDEPPPTPLWVKVFGAVALMVVLLFLIVLVIGSGHGPGRHGLGVSPPLSR